MKRRWRCQYGGGGFQHQFRGMCLIVLGLLFWSVSAQAYTGWEDWTGLGGSDNWSDPDNWANGVGNPVAPISTDTVRFGLTGSGSTSVVDTDFTISLLRYFGGGVHSMDVPAGSELLITPNPLQVGREGATGGAAVTWSGGGLVTITQAMNVGYNNTASAASASSLTLNGLTVDVGVSNPTSGGMALGANYGTGGADGTLILGPGSHFHAGSPAFPLGSSSAAGLTIGYNAGLAGSGTGAMDTSGGTANLHVENLYVGNNKNGEAGASGSASGTFTTGQNTTLTANRAYIARGDNTTGVMNMNGGLFAANTVSLGSGATFNFNGGRLAVNDFTTYGSAGMLEQKGGTLAPGFSRTETALAGTSIVRGNYQLDAPGTLEIELFGGAVGTEYDQLKVVGSVNLVSGTLDLKLNYEPLVGAQFVVIDNDLEDLVAGQFAGLPELGTLDEAYLGSTCRFQISYSSFGSGNDVVLEMVEKISPGPTTIPAPGALVLGGIGVGLLNWLRRRRTL